MRKPAMKKLNKANKTQKRKYVKPHVERIIIDNQISMVMQSTPPGDPGGSMHPEHFSINPFKLPNI